MNVPFFPSEQPQVATYSRPVEVPEEPKPISIPAESKKALYRDARRPSLSVTTSSYEYSSRRHMRATSSPVVSMISRNSGRASVEPDDILPPTQSSTGHHPSTSISRPAVPPVPTHTKYPGLETRRPFVPARRAITPTPGMRHALPPSPPSRASQFSVDHSPDLVGLLQAAMMLEERLTHDDGGETTLVSSPQSSVTTTNTTASSSHSHYVSPPPPSYSDSGYHSRQPSQSSADLPRKRSRKRSFRNILKRNSNVKDISSTDPTYQPTDGTTSPTLESPPLRKSSLGASFKIKKKTSMGSIRNRLDPNRRSPSPPPPLPSKAEHYASLGRIHTTHT